MALMEVVHYGDPILRKKCKPVEDYKKLSGLIDDMFDTMYEENGIGLAANQVGVDLNPVSYTHLTLPTTPYV